MDPERPPKPAAGSENPLPASTPVGAGAVAGFGLQFALSILLFLFAGQWIDRKLGTAPVFLMVFVFVGAGASFYSFYRKLMGRQRRDGERSKQ